MPNIEISWDLVKRANNNEQEAIDELFPAIFQLSRKYLYHRVLDFDAAQDLAQNVVIRLQRRLFAYSQETTDVKNFNPIVFKTAYHLFLNYWRDYQRHPTVLLSVIENNAEFSGLPLEEMLSEKEAVEKLINLLPILEEEERQILYLRYVGKVRLVDIGEIFDKSEGAIKSILHRVKAKLREAILAEEKEVKKYEERDSV